MAYEALINTASALFIICYIPELYANWKNKNANFYNMPEKIIMLIGSIFALVYSILNNDIGLMTNYGPIVGLDIIALLMRLYYVYRTPEKPAIVQDVDTVSRTSSDAELQIEIL
jgi:hypothetical protein